MKFELFLISISLINLSVCEEYRENTFSTPGVCPIGFILPVTPVATDVVRGRIQCAVKCVEDSACISINLCPDPSGGQLCQKLGSISNGLCSDLQAAPGCVHLQPKNLCKNGGVFNYPLVQCDCPYDFTGTYCERRYYDCSEAYSGGVRGPSPDNYYRFVYIQPMNAPREFLVQCWQGDGGWTEVDMRDDTSDFDRTWEEYKTGWIESSSRWIGLENLHYITSQAGLRCKLDIFVNATNNGRGKFYYDWITVGDEASLFALTYIGQHDHPDYPVGDGFAFGGLSKSIMGKGFATSDRPDPQGCAVSAGAGWWYGDQCPDTNLHKRMSSATTANNVAEWPDVNLNLEKVFYVRMQLRVFR